MSDSHKTDTQLIAELNAELTDARRQLESCQQQLLRNHEAARQEGEWEETAVRVKQLSKAIEQSPVSIIITDLQGNIEYVNPKFTAVTGYPLSEVKGKNPRILKSGHTDSHEYATMWQTITAGGEWRGEFYNQRKDGALFWELASISPITNDEGDITHYLAVKEDITERKAIEEALNQRNQELSSLYRAAHALTSTLDLGDLLTILLEEQRQLLQVTAGSVWLANAENQTIVCRHTTLPYRDIILNWTLPMGEGLIGWAIEHNSHLIVADATQDERHYKEIDKQTGLTVCSVLVVPLCVQERVIGAVQLVHREKDHFNPHDLILAESLAAIAANAIENALLVANLHQAQQKLIESEKLSALGQMAATVAHELRNPLMAVRLGVEYMTRGLDKADPRQAGANLMRLHMSRIDQLVEDILFVARKPQINKAAISLRTLLQDEANRWRQPLQERQITLETDFVANLPPLTADPHLIGRAVGNLLNNSADSLPTGGAIKLAMESDGQNQKIIVADNGEGITAENQRLIFDSFFTTRTKGIGLGLPIVKQIMEMHNGQIEVWSEAGQGTRFTLILPYAPEDRPGG